LQCNGQQWPVSSEAFCLTGEMPCGLSSILHSGSFVMLKSCKRNRQSHVGSGRQKRRLIDEKCMQFPAV
jgi:hypothetical protein